jgi:hypothetical protein
MAKGGFGKQVGGSTMKATKPPVQGFPPVARSGGVQARAGKGAHPAQTPPARVGGQYTSGANQGGAEVLTKRGAPGIKGGGTASDPKPPQGGGAKNLGREAKSNDRTPGTDNNAGEIRHPATHAAFEKLGVPKGGKY